MSIRILYFARVREDVGMAQEMLDLDAQTRDVKGLREQLIARGTPWSAAFAPGKAVRFAVNQDISRPDSAVRDGDEVAFFPPVTGG